MISDLYDNGTVLDVEGSLTWKGVNSYNKERGKVNAITPKGAAKFFINKESLDKIKEYPMNTPLLMNITVDGQAVTINHAKPIKNSISQPINSTAVPEDLESFVMDFKTFYEGLIKTGLHMSVDSAVSLYRLYRRNIS